MSKLTPWFHPDVRPVHRGIYERQYPRFVAYAYWDGTKWGALSFTPLWAKGRHRKHEYSWHRAPWRGLSRPSADSRTQTLSKEQG